jgi:hypothetical protein
MPPIEVAEPRRSLRVQCDAEQFRANVHCLRRYLVPPACTNMAGVQRDVLKQAVWGSGHAETGLTLGDDPVHHGVDRDRRDQCADDPRSKWGADVFVSIHALIIPLRTHQIALDAFLAPWR